MSRHVSPSVGIARNSVCSALENCHDAFVSATKLPASNRPTMIPHARNAYMSTSVTEPEPRPRYMNSADFLPQRRSSASSSAVQRLWSAVAISSMRSVRTSFAKLRS